VSSGPVGIDPEVMCVIPARSGSKRVADKNLRQIGGRPLLVRTIEVALAAFGRVFVSTDSPRYAALAEAAGAVVPDLRPPELATDETSTTAVAAHAARAWAPTGASVIVVAQATSPFTTADDLCAVVEALANAAAATAMTVVELPATAAYALRVEGGLARFALPDLRSLRTQDLPRLVTPSGGAYAAPLARLQAGGELVEEPIALVTVPTERAVDIDDEDDLRAAALLVELDAPRSTG
jgi:pseudaminic acid cytidylyltransferase